jgi:hypothetical protein
MSNYMLCKNDNGWHYIFGHMKKTMAAYQIPFTNHNILLLLLDSVIPATGILSLNKQGKYSNVLLKSSLKIICCLALY